MTTYDDWKTTNPDDRGDPCEACGGEHQHGECGERPSDEEEPPAPMTDAEIAAFATASGVNVERIVALVKEVMAEAASYPPCARCDRSMTHGERDICNDCKVRP